MILDIYKDSFEYAGQDIKTLIKLGLLSFFSFLIIPEFLVLGYQYRIIDVSINGMVDGDDKLPEFNNFTEMLVDGIKFFIVQLIYVVVPFLVFFIFVYLSQLFNNGNIAVVGMLIGVILLILAILYSFLAIPNMIANGGNFKKAFDFERLNEIIKMISVGKYVGFVIGLFLITFVISIVIAAILLFVLFFFGFTIAAINPFGISIVAVVWTILYVGVFSFIVTPYLGIFSGRANGLIYGIGA